VTVLEVNLEKKQIALSMKRAAVAEKREKRPAQGRRPRPESQRTSPKPGRAAQGGKPPQARPERSSNPQHAVKPKAAFNNPFGALAGLRQTLKPK